MKKIIAAISAAFALHVGYAQTSDVADFKPTQGKFLTELNVNPFRGDLKLNNALNQLKGRYFIKDDVALRMGFNINTLDSVDNVGSPYGTSATYQKSSVKSTTASLTFGIEKHFAGTKRLSPYIGADVNFGSRWSSHDYSVSQYVDIKVKNGSLQHLYQPYNNGYVNTWSLVSDAYTQIGLTGVAGFDYYMAKHFFFGYEFNLGYSKTFQKAPEVTFIGQDFGLGNFVSDGSVQSFKASVINGVRIGFVF